MLLTFSSQIESADGERREVTPPKVDALQARSGFSGKSSVRTWLTGILKHKVIDHVRSESAKLGDIAAQVTASAVDVASLGETFAFAVRSFNETNEKLMGNLQRIEQAIDKSMTRSDEQLAYYVAQAREIIDLSITSQKDVLETLQSRATPAHEGAV